MTVSKSDTNNKVEGDNNNKYLSGQPLIFEEDFTTPLPPWPSTTHIQNYPYTTGFLYVIDAIEECFKLKNEMCSEMRELPNDEQVFINILY
jgi:hypothetical protein